MHELVKHYQLVYYTKKLYSATLIKLPLFALLHKTESLRALSDCVFSEKPQQAIGLESISYSQLGLRLSQIPSDIFQAIFLDLIVQIHLKTNFQKRRKVTTPLKIIDSSTLPSNLTNHKWAKFRTTKSGV